MKILFLDDERWRHEAVERRMPGHSIHHAYTIRAFRHALQEHRFDLASLDHDLSDDASETGMHAVEILIAMPRELAPKQIIVHSSNQRGAALMMHTLQQAGFAPERQMFRSEMAERTAEAERRFKERNGG